MSGYRLFELNWQQRNQWPLELKIGVGLFFFIGMFFLTYCVLVISVSRTWHFLKLEEGSLRLELKKKYRKLGRLDAYHRESDELKREFNAVLTLLPKQNEILGLFEAIAKAGTEKGVIFKLFVPLKEVKHDFYIELPVKITLLGTYQQLGVFINQLTHMQRLLTVSHFTIFTTAKNQLEPHLDHSIERLLEMNMTIKIYKYDERQKAVTRYLQALPKTSVQKINPLPMFKPISAFSYPEKKAIRDPFNLKHMHVNRLKHPLEQVALEDLKLVGMIEGGGRRLALVMSSKDEIFQIAEGDCLSQHHARVVGVNEKMLILEASFFREGKWIKEKKRLYLQESLTDTRLAFY